MGKVRVAVDVGGTFTDICILDEDGGTIEVGKVPSTTDPIDAVVTGVVDAGVDLRDVVVFSHGTTVATNALITRNLPAGGDGDHAELPRRDRDPARDEAGSLGRVRGRRAAVHPAPRPVRGDRADRPRRRGREPARRGRGAAGGGGSCDAAGSQTVAVCFINAYANPAHEQRMREILEEELPGRDRLDVGGGAARDLRARAVLDDGRERGALAADLRLRQPAAGPAGREQGYDGRRAAAPLGRRRDDAEAGRAVRRAPRRLGHRRGRDRQPAPRDAVRLPERDRLRHGRHVHRRLARLRRRGARHEGVVRRVRLPDLLPVDRGADDRGRRRLVRVDRRGRLAAQRAAVGRREPWAGLLRPWERPADEHRREPRARPARGRADRRRDDARPSGRRARDLRARRRPARARIWCEAADAVIQVANANMADACG